MAGPVKMLAGQVIICTTGSTVLVEKNELSALANKAFKVIVSCLTVWWIRTSLDWARIFKNGLSVVKTSQCYDDIFDSVALVSWIWLWLQLFRHTDVYSSRCFNRLNNKTFQVSHLLAAAVSPKQNYLIKGVLQFDLHQILFSFNFWIQI